MKFPCPCSNLRISYFLRIYNFVHFSRYWRSRRNISQLQCLPHKRRMETEGIGKGRHVGLGGNICLIPCRAWCFECYSTFWNKQLKSVERNSWIQPFFSNRPRQNSECSKELNKVFPPKQMRRPLPCLLFPFFFYMVCHYWLCKQCVHLFADIKSA